MQPPGHSQVTLALVGPLLNAAHGLGLVLSAEASAGSAH